MKHYEFEAEIRPASKKGGAYVIFPYDIQAEFGKKRVKVHVQFDGMDYQGSIVNMGVKDEDGAVCYIIGVLKAIRKSLGKDIGDRVCVKVTPALEQTTAQRELISRERVDHNTAKEHKIFDMAFSSVYPLYIQKVERKARTKEEVDTAIRWLTGYTNEALANILHNGTTFRDFFAHAPQMNDKAALITGSICGVKIQDIAHPLMKQIRYLDKLVDDIAKGKSMDKVLRK